MPSSAASDVYKRQGYGKNFFTLTEVARALRISDETIRRRIASGELTALEVAAGSRKTYRLLFRDLVAWLGPERANAHFGLGALLDEVRAQLAHLSPDERIQVLEEALVWAQNDQDSQEPVLKRRHSTQESPQAEG